MLPTLLTINGFKIESYWVLMFLSYFFAGLILYFLGRKRNFPAKELISFILIVSIFGFIGARLCYILLNPNIYFSQPIKILMFWQGGFTSFGGIILGIITGLLYLKFGLKKNTEEIKKWLDIGMLAFLFGHGIGRIGCFLEGCCYGKTTASLFGVIFPSLNDGIYRHPTQLYESFGYFLTYFLLLAQSNRKNILNGSIFGWGLFFHELVRFIVEFFRENTLYFLQLPHLTLSSAQLVDIILMVMSLIFLHYFVYSKNQNL